jgi:hypothetical protein
MRIKEGEGKDIEKGVKCIFSSVETRLHAVVSVCIIWRIESYNEKREGEK